MGTATGWNHPAQISWSLVTHWPTLLELEATFLLWHDPGWGRDIPIQWIKYDEIYLNSFVPSEMLNDKIQMYFLQVI